MSTPTWTTEAVAARFSEAAEVARKLPAVRVQGYFNVWPRIARESWETLGADDRPLRFPPTPQAIDRMLETMKWVQCLEVPERKIVWMRAQRDRWAFIAKRFGVCTKTAQRRHERAITRVTAMLNGETVIAVHQLALKEQDGQVRLHVIA